VVDWFLTHWQAILAAIVAIGTPIVAILIVAIPWVAATKLVSNAL
jgi:hypothetical protein